MSEEGMSSGTLIDELLQLFYTHDPIGLRGPGMPLDEYRPEVAAVLPHLTAMYSPQDVRTLLWGTFSAYFAPLDVGPEEGFTSLAHDVWDILQRY